MSDTTRVPDTAPKHMHIRRLDDICDAFESAWVSGDTPVVERFLGDIEEPDRTELLSELIRVDVHYRRQGGETPTPADYAHRFPTLSPAFWSRAIGAPHSQVGAVLNGYQLKEEIGHGGMGRVYRASHPRLDQDVALKLPTTRHGFGADRGAVRRRAANAGPHGSSAHFPRLRRRRHGRRPAVFRDGTRPRRSDQLIL